MDSKITFSDLPCDITNLIGSHLFKGKTTAIHKIFHDNQDMDLQVMLFGDVNDSRYFNIKNYNNEIPYFNDDMKKYVNVVLEKNYANERCCYMTVNVFNHPSFKPKIEIRFYNKDGLKIALTKHYELVNCNNFHLKHKYKIHYLIRGFIWCKSNIKKRMIVNECDKIRKEITDKYF
jgi:hypothetical protein